MKRYPVQHLRIPRRQTMKDQAGKLRSILRAFIQSLQPFTHSLRIDPLRHSSGEQQVRIVYIQQPMWLRNLLPAATSSGTVHTRPSVAHFSIH